MKLSEFLRKASSEDNGNPSSMRTIAFMVCTQFSLVLSVGFIMVIIKHPELVIAYAGLLLSAILGVLGIKGWQKNKEEKVITPPEEKPAEQGAAPQ